MISDRTRELRARDGQLWTEWKKHHLEHGLSGKLVSDGIADPERFRKEALRVLFVLKEPNKWEDVDLRGQLNKGAEYIAWHNIARWAAGALEGFPPFEQVDRQTAKDEALKRIAVINVKKAPGGGTADASVIGAFAFQDRKLLRRQLEEIAPTVVVACGRSVLAALVWLLELEFEDPTNPTGAAKGKGEVVVLPWTHPSTRKKKRDLYLEFEERWRSEGLPVNDGLSPSTG